MPDADSAASCPTCKARAEGPFDYSLTGQDVYHCLRCGTIWADTTDGPVIIERYT